MVTVVQTALMLLATIHLQPAALRMYLLRGTLVFAIRTPEHQGSHSQQGGMPDDKSESTDPNGQSVRTVAPRRSTARTSNPQIGNVEARPVDFATGLARLRNVLI